VLKASRSTAHSLCDTCVETRPLRLAFSTAAVLCRREALPLDYT